MLSCGQHTCQSTRRGLNVCLGCREHRKFCLCISEKPIFTLFSTAFCALEPNTWKNSEDTALLSLVPRSYFTSVKFPEMIQLSEINSSSPRWTVNRLQQRSDPDEITHCDCRIGNSVPSWSASQTCSLDVHISTLINRQLYPFKVFYLMLGRLQSGDYSQQLGSW